MVIRATGIHKSYGSQGSDSHVSVLQGVDLTVDSGEVVSIVGASGAGKSTLLHILGTIDQPDEGSVTINGTELRGLRGSRLARFRNRSIGFVFQFHHLLPEFTALENIMLPAQISGKRKAAVQARATKLLGQLGLGNRAQHKPSQLSGGEQQRVAVARALMNEPDVVFADEPSGNLDSQNALELHQLFFELRDQLDQTFVIATHNESLAQMSDRCLRMRDGRIDFESVGGQSSE